MLERRRPLWLQVLNDFVAIGYAVPTLTADDVHAVNDVPVQAGAPIAVLGPGTGLGETQLFWDTGASGYTAFASEVRALWLAALDCQAPASTPRTLTRTGCSRERSNARPSGWLEATWAWKMPGLTRLD